MRNKRIGWKQFFLDIWNEIKKQMDYIFRSIVGMVRFSILGSKVKKRSPLGNAGIIRRNEDGNQIDL